MRRLPSLTSARFFAAMLVVAFHSHVALDVAAVTPLARVGYTGVAFFFTLSGFVLTWGTPRDLPPAVFYRRRFARIWPLTAVTLMIGLALAGISPLNVARFLVAALLLQAWVPFAGWHYGISGVTWSLSAEAFYYALTPLLLRLTIRRPLRLIAPLVAVAFGAQILLTAALPGNVEQWATYIAPPALLPAFLAGHLLARAMIDGALPKVPTRVLVVPVACLAAAVLLVESFDRAGTSVFFFMGGIATLTVPGWLAVIAWLVRTDEAKRTVLDRRQLIRLGEWSFALYLLHGVVFVVADRAGWDGGTGSTLALWVMCVLVSGIAYYVVERPLEDRLRGGRPSRPLADAPSG